MTNSTENLSSKAGLQPGSLVYTGEKKPGETEIGIIDYDESEFQEKKTNEPQECFQFKEKTTVTWININGLDNPDIVGQIGNHFGVHPLNLEDISSVGQRPKLEESDDYIFVVLRMFYLSDRTGEIESEQISLILASNLVISFQESKGDLFDPIRERIRNNKGKIRTSEADYLAYALIDVIVDNYFKILEKVGEDVESIEKELVENPTPETLQEIHDIKEELISLRKSIWPLRDVISKMERNESTLITENTKPYIRDVYDHTIQVIETIETHRDMVSSILDIYLSSVSNRMNEVMKVLTIIATIFIPLTFLAGIYGMNFDYMPELAWKWGYPIVLLIMFLIVTGMAYYFRRREWL